MKDRELVRYGAAFGLAGAAIGIVANLLHPRTFATAETARFQLIADSGIWKLDHYLIGAAVLLSLAGLVAFASYMEGRPGHAWARFGFVTGVIGGAIGILVAAIDGWAIKTLADRWAEAGSLGDGAAFAALDATEQISTGLFTVFTGVLFGATALLVGIATYRSGVFPKWLGLMAIAGGVLGLGVDAFQSLDAPTPFTANVLVTIASLSLTLWFIGVNLILLRATASETAAEPRSAVPAT